MGPTLGDPGRAKTNAAPSRGGPPGVAVRIARFPFLVAWAVVRRLVGAGLIILGAWGAMAASFLALPTAACFVLLLISAYFLVVGEEPVRPWLCLGVIAGWFAAMITGMLAFPAGRSLLSPTYWESSWRHRPPILLLRSFTDDGSGTPFDYGTKANKNTARAVGTGLGDALGGGALAGGAGLAAANSVIRMMHMSESFEEVVVRRLKAYGPVVAISEPGRKGSPAGAARLAVRGEGEEWKDVVKDLVRRSSLIVMIVGKTPGVAWEVRTLIERGVGDKLWLLFPPRTPSEVAERWKLFREELVAAGIDEVPESIHDGTALVRFAPGWTPRPSLSVAEREAYMRLVKESARSYFRDRGYFSFRGWFRSHWEDLKALVVMTTVVIIGIVIAYYFR